MYFVTGHKAKLDDKVPGGLICDKFCQINRTLRLILVTTIEVKIVSVTLSLFFYAFDAKKVRALFFLEP